jgi:AraC family transcriptional regulator of adaptative response / DNA-3-methyladenine glycosylase II
MHLGISRRFSVDAAVSSRALNARDGRFDGVFFVGITTTHIYCRPICPSRFALDRNRRFFATAAAAEHAGFRPCLRCRPELAPGRALCEAVSRLARVAVHRITAGALNGRSVAQLARELGVSERHLRRALEREIGVSPVELAQTHRLLLAKRLLADTKLSITTIAFTSGFQSLRRFNTVFRARYGMSPTVLRRAQARRGSTEPLADFVRLTLAYRAPLAWSSLLALLGAEAVEQAAVVNGPRYGRTVRIDGRSGAVFVEQAPGAANLLNVDISLALTPVLMPLLARLRQLLDLDAEPAMIDACLAHGGLRRLVKQTPGLRIPGAFDGFELVLCALLNGSVKPGTRSSELMRRVTHAFGESIDTGVPTLTRLMPTAAQIADAGCSALVALGTPKRRANALVAIARMVAAGSLRLEAGSDPVVTRDALLSVESVGDRLATTLVMRALRWPDAFPASDPSLTTHVARAESWRPWRAYAALHLWLGARRQ